MKTRKNKKIGGQVANYNIQAPWHMNYEVLNAGAYDCGPSACHVLGYCNDDVATYMAQTWPEGISGDTMIWMIRRAYNDNNRWVHVSRRQLQRNFIHHITQNIGHHQATLASIGGNGGGHYFVIYNNGWGPDGNLQWCILDPQRHYMYFNLAEFLNRFEHYDGNLRKEC